MNHNIHKDNILITGASGFIGRHLCAWLEKRYNIFKLVSTKQEVMIEKEIRVDLTNKQQIIGCFKDLASHNGIDVIIHLASRLSAVDRMDDLTILYDNLKITENIIDAACCVRPRKLINFSSTAVYPNIDGLYNEKGTINPSVNTDCLYGLSKFCSEVLFDFLLRDQDVIVTHLRVCQVYGEDMRHDRIIPVMLKELEQSNTITVYGDGRRVSCFIGIAQLLEALDLFIAHDIKGVYNIGDENISYMDLARGLIAKYGNENSSIITKSGGQPNKIYIDTSLFNSIKTTYSVQ